MEALINIYFIGRNNIFFLQIFQSNHLRSLRWSLTSLAKEVVDDDADEVDVVDDVDDVDVVDDVGVVRKQAMHENQINYDMQLLLILHFSRNL